MTETPDEVRARLAQEARDNVAKRLANANSVNASDGAMMNLRFELNRIDRMSDEQLRARAKPFDSVSEESHTDALTRSPRPR